MKNKVQLIVYADRFSGGNLEDLEKLITGPLNEIAGGIHILPFYFPIDGADAGFDPIDHLKVDPKLGNWNSIKSISQHVDVMADLIVNHVSSDSAQFTDFSKLGDQSDYNGFFLTYNGVFPDGATEEELMAIYRPRPGLPFTYSTLVSGEKRLLWTTFTSKQIDIDVTHPSGQDYLNSILKVFSENGIKMIRLDAAGYAIKKPGTSCFMIPETFEFISSLSDRANQLGIESLVEIHSYYQTQIDIAKKVDWVYDFALPPLLLHAFFFKTSRYLKRWIGIRPNNAVTVLDTHDGIGIVDIGPNLEDPISHPGLVPDEELDQMVDIIHHNSNGESKKATGAAASNLDLYQVNCTYLDALGGKELPYLLARTIQFFIPGIPQVYYAGLFFGRNDMELLNQSNVGRDINRHYYSKAEIEKALDNKSVRQFFRLIRLRNIHPAFSGTFSIEKSLDTTFVVKWQNDQEVASLQVNFESLDYEIIYSKDGVLNKFLFEDK